jgi:hypothetical protein
MHPGDADGLDGMVDMGMILPQENLLITSHRFAVQSSYCNLFRALILVPVLASVIHPPRPPIPIYSLHATNLWMSPLSQVCLSDPKTRISLLDSCMTFQDPGF